MSILNTATRSIINIFNRRRLINKNPSIIASNCNGACICHDLGIRFNSPFVDLWIKPSDFIILLNNLKYYMNISITFVKEEGISYPVGQLGDIRIYFQHYKTEDEARNKWEERKKRLDYDNLYIMFSDRDGCTYEELRNFNSLPYAHKVVFTNKPYPEFKSVFYIEGFENKPSVGILTTFKNKYGGRKYYDAFDYVSWLNQRD